MDYWLTRDDQNYGPYSEGDLRQWLQTGQVQADDLVWHEGQENWVPLKSLFGIGAVIRQFIGSGNPNGEKSGILKQDVVRALAGVAVFLIVAFFVVHSFGSSNRAPTEAQVAEPSSSDEMSESQILQCERHTTEFNVQAQVASQLAQFQGEETARRNLEQELLNAGLSRACIAYLAQQ